MTKTYSAEHAKLLPPSASDRWTVCTASAAICATYDDEPGEDAIRGTEAHYLLLDQAVKQRKHPREIDPEHHSIEAVSFAYDQIKHLFDVPGIQIFVEIQVKYSDDLWGTIDMLVIFPDGRMIVIDYKNGVLPVEADCLQVLIYKAAALKTAAWMSPVPITKVGSIIIQPNGLDGLPTKTIERTVAEVEQEMAEKVLPAVEAIGKDDGSQEFVVTEKGCKWCPHGRSGNCGPFNRNALDIVKSHFDPVGELVVPETETIESLTDDQCAKILAARPLFKKFITAIEDRSLATVKSGGKIPGFKMVNGRSSSSWSHDTDAETLEFLTKTLKFKKGDAVTEKVLTPAAATKMVKALKRNKDAKLALLDEAITRTEGKLTLVSEDSKKKEVVMFQELPAIDAGSVLS